MAWVSEASITLSTGKDYGEKGTFADGSKFDYTDMYAAAKLTASTSGDKVSYTVTMETGSGSQPFVWLYLSIDNQVIYNDYYGSSYQSKFPRKNGSSASGSITTTTANNSSIPIVLKVRTSAQGPTGAKEASGTLTRTWYANVGTGTTTIVDNYNNTFTISATKGADGTNNAAGGPTNLKYGYSSAARNTTYTSGGTYNLSLSGTGNTRTVYAESTTTAKYGNNQTATASLAIRQYRAPNAPGTPELTADSRKNDRLTVKQNWTYLWTPATPGTGTGTTAGTGANQTTSKVTGYRVQLYRKRTTENTFSSIPIKSGSNTLSTHSNGEHFYDIGTNSITINPIDCAIVAGDQVKLGICPYTQYGENNDGNKLFSNVTTYSAESTVQNAGVMRVKPNNTVDWKEGVVWVKVNKGGTLQWVEADVVKVKTSNGWKESV